MMSRIRVGIVGAGYMGREWARTISRHPRFELGGVFSRSSERAEKIAKEFSSVVTQSVEELNQLNPDAVVVAVPELSLPAVFEVCAKFEWAVLTEKPAGIDVEVAKKLQERARKRTGASFVALNRRFYSSTQEMVSRVSTTTSPAEFLLVDQHDPLLARSAGQPDEVARKWHFANAIHTLDLLRFIGRGEPEVVSRTREPLGSSSFVVKADIAFSSSDKATYLSVWNAPGPWMLQCFTERALLELRPLEQLWQTPTGSRTSEKISQGAVDTRFKPGLWVMLDELSHFYDSGSCRLPSFEDSLKSMSFVAEVFGAGAAL